MLEGSILRKLRDAHGVGSSEERSPLNFGVYYKNTLVALCHALEDSILTEDYAPLVITAFQRGKWYLEEANRYADIADRSRQIVIMAAAEAGFADHPTSQRANVALVPLEEGDPVGQEWHLIIVSPTYTAMVLCQELSEADYGAAGVPEADLERKFYGLWTFEPGLVLETAALAIAHVGRYNPDLQATLTGQLQAIATQTQPHQDSVSTTDHLGEVVSRVVDYLQTSPSSGTAGSWASASQVGLENNLTSNKLQAFLRVAELIDQADLSNPMAAAEVATLAETLGQILDLPAWQLHRLRLAGLLHRIALWQHTDDPSLLNAALSPQPSEAPPLTCPLVPGTQLLRRMNRMKAIATILTHQSEWWNGTGHPAGLVGDAIPLESRILGLAAAFQQRLAAQTVASSAPSPEQLDAAFVTCRAEQGDRWDPKVVEALELLVNGLKQGLSLPRIVPKIASGLWLLDSHADEDLIAVEQFDSSVARPSTR